MFGIFALLFKLVWLCILLVVYLIPTGVAISRRHPHLVAILLVNLIFGATVFGWVICLIWALWTPSAYRE